MTEKMAKPVRILIAEDEAAFRETAAEILSDAGMEVEAVENGSLAWEAFRAFPHDVVISDIHMPGLDGLSFLEKARELVPTVPVLMITAYGSLENAVEALRRGARDYITKPCDLDELRLRVERVIKESTLARTVEVLTRDSRAQDFGPILGNTETLKRVFQQIEKVSATPTTIYISGESGTGKELVAREIHRRSGLDRFVPVNCGAIPEQLVESELFGHRKGSFTGAINHKEGLFRLADNGTLFLDEIGELGLQIQVKLLRALDMEEIQPVGAPGPIKCAPRILAATNKNLEEEVRQGRFREDLFYRLNVVQIHIPPLRERKEDIAILAQHFVQKFARRAACKIRGIRPDALRALMAAPWRGNVRELENVIERAVILSDSDEILLADLPASFADPGDASVLDDLRSAVNRFEKDYIYSIIERNGGDKRAAASLLGIGLSSLYRKLD